MPKKTIKLQNQKLALRADSGLAIGTIYPIVGKRNILGRSIDAAVPVDDVKVSRVHASIDQQNGFHYLVDLGSTNGTYLNGSRVQNSSRLTVGDRVRLGSTVFIVEFLDHAKTLVAKNWKEPTRAIIFGEEDRKRLSTRFEALENEISARSASGKQKKERSLAEIIKLPDWFEKMGIKKKSLTRQQSRWLSLAILGMIVTAAIASSFSTNA